MDVQRKIAWRARGLIFENCNCQSVCPGHMHFDQLCTHERCLGYWAVRIDEGAFDGVSLDGVKAVIAYDSPQHMIAGNWTEVVVIDQAASPAQRHAVEAILTGRRRRPVGGPGPLRGTPAGHPLSAHRSRRGGSHEESENPRLARSGGHSDPGPGPRAAGPVSEHVQSDSRLDAGDRDGATEYDDGVIRISTTKTHGLFSNFDWVVEEA